MSDILIKDFSVDMLTLGDNGSFHFQKEKIPTLPGWGEPDVLRMLQLLPGIGSAEESAARLNVRGGTPDQNLVLWEGIPIYHTGHFFGQYDAFNPFIVDEVDVWRGNFGAEHGGRNSSVIDIKGRPDLVDESTWGIGFNLLHANIFMEKPLFRKTKYKRGAILLAGRTSNASNKSKVFRELFDQVFQNGRVALPDSLRQNNESTTWNPLIEYGDFNLKMRWQGKNKNDNAISLYTGFDRLDYYYAFDDSLTFTSTKDLINASNFGISWQHSADWKPNLKAQFKMAASAFNNEYTFRWNDEPDSIFIYQYNTTNLLQDFSTQMNVDWTMDESKKWTFGYHFTAQQSNLVYRDTHVLKKELNVFSQDTSVLGLHTFYSAFDHQLNKQFRYTIGLRLNLFPSRNLYFTEPRASFVWRPLGNEFSLKGSMARNWQFVFQIVDFTDLGAGEPLWALAKDSIPAQELWQWTFGAGYETKSMLIDAELYYKDSRNLTSRNLLVDRGFERPLSFDGSSVAYGFDFLFRKRIPPYSIWLAYSFGQVEQKFPELNSGITYPARHDIRHQVNFVNMLDLGKFDLSANLHFRTGTPYSIPTVVQVPCPDCTVDNYTHELSFDKLNTERLPSTLRVDVSATYSFGKKNRKWKMGLSFFNLLNRTNIIDKDFVLDTPDPDEPQADYKLQELNRLAAGRAPNFFLQYEW
ncbi:MAG: TonB-dependent receptor plug domain-containing protein [Saprospiraceae bacterium]